MFTEHCCVCEGTAGSGPHLVSKAQLLQVPQALELRGVDNGDARPVQLKVACISTRVRAGCSQGRGLLCQLRTNCWLTLAGRRHSSTCISAGLTMNRVVEYLLPPVARVLVPILLGGHIDGHLLIRVQIHAALAPRVGSRSCRSKDTFTTSEKPFSYPSETDTGRTTRDNRQVDLDVVVLGLKRCKQLC